jgi:hypothetical protein
VVRHGALAILAPAEDVSGPRLTIRLPAEEHHGRLGEESPVTTGTVRRIQVVRCALVSDPADGDVLVAAPGSALLTDVNSWRDGPKSTFRAGEHVRRGYLVDLETDQDIDERDRSGAPGT